MPEDHRPHAINTETTADGIDAALSRVLLASGQVDARGLERARRAAAEGGGRLADALTQLGFLGERLLAETIAGLTGLPLASPADYPIAPVLPERLRAKFLRKARALPTGLDSQGGIRLAMADPLDSFTSAAVAVATGRRVIASVAVPAELEAAFERLYAERPSADDDHEVGNPAEIDGTEPSGDDAERLKDLASEAPVIRLVNQIIARAVETRASDIHLEPFEDRLRIRYRYDGVLHEIEAPPPRLQAAIISRVKIMARLDIAERRLPQDGRVKLAVRGNDVDFRVSTVPGLHGETVVLRVLDRSAVDLRFDSLGLGAGLREGLAKALELPNGIVLVTGPTGSGKTTTLYTALLHINSISRKIVSVEDPIEYQLPGINQIQVKPQIGLNFANLLRAILRQDPDVIMIGEIRDAETAQIAVQAALTGHLVLSTLHTNSAAATITRLRDMGLEDYLLTATLNAVLAQRLVRRLCMACRRPVEAAPELIARFGLDRLTGHSGPIIVHEAVGCPQCRGTGYSGRTAIGELLVPNETTHRLVLEGADQGAIQRAAVADGMRTLHESGLLEVLAGNTTLAEMTRSVRAEE